MNTCSDQEREAAWLQAVRAFCQERGASSLQVGQPAQVLVEWPITDQPMLVQIGACADYGLLFLLPLGSIPPSDRQAALMAAGALNWRTPLTCVEVEPLSGEARIRVAVTVSDQPAARLIELAFGQLEEAVVGFVKGIAAFKALTQASQAQHDSPLPDSPEALAKLWNGREITD